jgi:hypothetical protein
MIASGLSTIITTTPLFATQTLILQTFAYVIAITMLVGLIYVFLFLAPTIGMFGPSAAYRGPTAEGPTWKRVLRMLFLSKAVRFIFVCAMLFLFLVCLFPCLGVVLGRASGPLCCSSRAVLSKRSVQYCATS